MKLTAIILCVTAMQVAAKGFSQTVTFSAKNVPVKTVFNAIEKQTGFVFFYDASLLGDTKPVTVDLRNASIEQALRESLKDQPIGFTIESKTIFLSRKAIPVVEQPQPPPPIEVKGRVTDENNEPVAGATVTVKGTTNATATDANGNYVLRNVDENATLLITGANIESYEVKVNSRVTVNATVRIAVRESEEVVVAYNRINQKSNVGAITVIKPEQIQNIPNRSIDKSLQGLVPGLLVTSGSGQPGAGLSNFVLRGIATAASTQLGSTVRNPLIVVDGVPVTQDHNQLYIDSYTIPVDNPMAQLNPSDIESISVLKDAAAFALYGAKASNGVILITTKRGRAGKTNFNFRHQTDLATRIKLREEMVTPTEYMELLFESYRNFNPSLYATDIAILRDLRTNAPVKFPSIVNGTDTSFYPAVNWEDELYGRTAATITNEISMSGGNERSLFYLNLEYLKQNGILKASDFDRKSLRFNFENKPADWLKIGLNSTVSHTIQNYGFPTRVNGVTGQGQSPLNPVRLTSGDYYYNFVQPFMTRNPVAASELNINRNASFRGLFKLYGEATFRKNFRFTSTVGLDYISTEAKEKNDPRLIDSHVSLTDGGRIEERTTRRANIINTNILRYDRLFGKRHGLSVILGQESQILNFRTMSIAVGGLPLPHYDQINSPGVTLLRRDGISTKETLVSYFGQTNYTLDKKYFLSASLRRDGSSRFGEDNRFGTYWSLGAGWELTREPFMRSLESWVNYIKIRSSIGAAGNAGAIDAFTRYDRLSSGFYNGGIVVIPTTSPGNPDVRWEETFIWDAGIESRFWKDRLSITVDVYKRKTTDLIYAINLAPTSGYYNGLANVGEMENKGTEVSMGIDIIKNNSLVWNLNTNWSNNQNKLVKAYVNTVTATLGTPFSANEVGRNFNSFYMVRWAGVDPANGRPQWIDSTGQPNSNFAAAKKEFVGKPQPDGFGAITNTVFYKNFELAIQLYYQYGFQVYRDFFYNDDGTYGYVNQSKKALDRWQKPGDVAANPRRVLFNTEGGATNVSTRYLFDADFVRLKQISLAYNFKPAVFGKLGLRSLRLYAQGNNLAIWSKFKDGDPDNINVIGSSSTPYPVQRSFSIGLNAGF